MRRKLSVFYNALGNQQTFVAIQNRRPHVTYYHPTRASLVRVAHLAVFCDISAHYDGYSVIVDRG